MVKNSLGRRSVRRVVLGVVPVALLVLVAAGGGDEAPKKLHYLTAESVDVEQLLPPPPAPGSAEDKRDLETVLRVQQTRTEAQLEFARKTNDFTVFTFGDLIGSGFAEAKLPKTAKLFSHLEKDSKHFTTLGKELWHRPRPYFASESVHSVGEKEKEGSYPSGHSTRATLFALVLADLYPEKRAALIDRSREDGFARIVLGVHYPTDIFAGRVLGQALYHEVMKSEKFRGELEEVKQELRSAGLLK